MGPVVMVLSWSRLPNQFDMSIIGARWWYCALAILPGLWSGLLNGSDTEFYMSSPYVLVWEATIIPVASLFITILVAH